MRVIRIVGDRWEGTTNHEWTVEAPALDAFETALSRLDGTTFTEIVLDGGQGRHLAIGGGGGRYVVYAAVANDEFVNLLHCNPRDGTVKLTAGGQEGDYPARRVVTIEEARDAGRTFLQAGELDPRQRWIRG
jgi:hypothetical protein